MQLKVLFEDEDLICVQKPAGFHVHPPEKSFFLIAHHKNCLRIVRDQIQTYIYPVHRLDARTSGVLCFAKTKKAATNLCSFFKTQEVKKTYFCVVRGFFGADQVIDQPLILNERHYSAQTAVETIATLTLPVAVSRYKESRYALLKVRPLTGRMHQIRKHLAKKDHPIVGDTRYGDSKHNRFFKESLNIHGLCLLAAQLEFMHPLHGTPLSIHAHYTGFWHQIFDLFGVCPFLEKKYGQEKKDF